MGNPGADGKDGVQGPKGDPGADGSDGVQGPKGQQHIHQSPPFKTINFVNDSFLFPPYEHLWGDPGPPGKNAQRANYTLFYLKHKMCTYIRMPRSITTYNYIQLLHPKHKSVCAHTHTHSFSILPGVTMTTTSNR